MTHYVQHTDGRAIEYKKYNLFTINRLENSYNLPELFNFFHTLHPEFGLKELARRHQALRKYFPENAYYIYVPMNLVAVADPDNAEHEMNDDLEKFQAFIAEIKYLNDAWQAVKPKIKSLQTQLSENYKSRKTYHRTHNDKLVYRFVEDGYYRNVPVQLTEKAHLDYLNKIQGQPSIKDLYMLGIYNKSDVIDTFLSNTVFSRLMSRELYQTNSYELVQSATLKVEPTSVAFIAVTDPNRVPSECWAKSVGSGGNTNIHFVDTMSEATAYTDNEVRQRAVDWFKSYHQHYDYAVVEFQASPVKVSNTTDFANKVQAGIEAQMLQNAVPSSEHKKVRHKL